MVEQGDKERLARLDARIAELRAKPAEGGSRAQDHHSQGQLAWRMVTELVAGLLIGFGIGLGLDALLGTRPIMLVLFTLLGFAAGVRTMLRTAGELQVEKGTGAGGDVAARKEGDGRRG